MKPKSYNPMPSKSPCDAVHNIEALDEFTNSQEPTYEDRFDQERQTLSAMKAGMEDRFQETLLKIGYEQIGDYAAGLEITEYNQIFRYQGEWWRASATTELPYTTTGDWGDEEGLFVAVGDAALRQELANPTGAEMVGYKHSNPSLDTTTVSAFLEKLAIPITMFANGDGTDETAAIQAAVDSGEMVIDGLGKTFRVSQINMPSNIALLNFNFEKIPSMVDHVNVLSWESLDAQNPIRNVYLENVHINGNRAQEKNVISPTENGGRSGFRFRGFVNGVTIKNCSARYCGTDGLIIFLGGIASPDNPLSVRNVTVEDCTFDWNRRHGISGDSLKNVSFVRVTAQRNGRNVSGGEWEPYDGGHGDWVGSIENPVLYGNGCDIESYGPDNHSEDLRFIDCDMRLNARGGLLLLEVRPELHTGLKQWRNIDIRGGLYDKGANSIDQTSIYVGVNGTSTETFSPDTNFLNVSIDTNTLGDRVTFRRANGDLKLLQTPDPFVSYTVAQFLVRSKGRIILSDADKYYVDDTANIIHVSRLFRERVTQGFNVPSASVYQGNVALSSPTSQLLFDAISYKKFQVRAQLVFPNTSESSIIQISRGSYKYIDIEDIILTTPAGHARNGDIFIHSQNSEYIRLYVQGTVGVNCRLVATVRVKG